MGCDKQFKQREELKKFDECGFEEGTFYYVWMSWRDGNPPYTTVLFTGFKTGSYRSAYSAGESQEFDSRARFEIISKIGKEGYTL